jgi:hypothetical protein
MSLELTGDIERLRDETEGKRKIPFKDLYPEDRQAIKRLNRLTLEAAYPLETPKCGYALIALIRTRGGEHSLRDYPNQEDFKQEIREKKNDIEWAFLIRSDEGKVIDKYLAKLGDRAKIGLIETEPMNMEVTPWGLNPQQASLREAAINHFKSHKAKAFISEQTDYVNANRQLSEVIKELFDEHGNPPANAPIEDIIEDRKRIELKIRWLEATWSELRHSLALLREIEDSAIEVLGSQSEII